MGEEMGRLVERDVAEPAAEDDPERRPGDEIVDVAARGDVRRRVGQAQRQPPADDDARDIGERVPAQREGPDAEDLRLDGREGEREHAHR